MEAVNGLLASEIGISLGPRPSRLLSTSDVLISKSAYNDLRTQIVFEGHMSLFSMKKKTDSLDHRIGTLERSFKCRSRFLVQRRYYQWEPQTCLVRKKENRDEAHSCCRTDDFHLKFLSRATITNHCVLAHRCIYILTG
jgi:hypothetical protein